RRCQLAPSSASASSLAQTAAAAPTAAAVGDAGSRYASEAAARQGLPPAAPCLAAAAGVGALGGLGLARWRAVPLRAHPAAGRCLPAACPECDLRLCFACGEPWHPGSACVAVSDSLVDQWAVERDAGRCPQCRTMIERSAGCNHMTCRPGSGGCGHQFCWLCREPYRPGHFTRGTCPQYGGAPPRDVFRGSRLALVEAPLTLLAGVLAAEVLLMRPAGVEETLWVTALAVAGLVAPRAAKHSQPAARPLLAALAAPVLGATLAGGWLLARPLIGSPAAAVLSLAALEGSPVRPLDQMWGVDRVNKFWARALRQENAGIRAGTLFLAAAAAAGAAGVLLHKACMANRAATIWQLESVKALAALPEATSTTFNVADLGGSQTAFSQALAVHCPHLSAAMHQRGLVARPAAAVEVRNWVLPRPLLELLGEAFLEAQPALRCGGSPLWPTDPELVAMLVPSERYPEEESDEEAAWELVTGVCADPPPPGRPAPAERARARRARGARRPRSRAEYFALRAGRLALAVSGASGRSERLFPLSEVMAVALLVLALERVGDPMQCARRHNLGCLAVRALAVLSQVVVVAALFASVVGGGLAMSPGFVCAVSPSSFWIGAAGAARLMALAALFATCPGSLRGLAGAGSWGLLAASSALALGTLGRCLALAFRASTSIWPTPLQLSFAVWCVRLCLELAAGVLGGQLPPAPVARLVAAVQAALGAVAGLGLVQPLRGGATAARLSGGFQPEVSKDFA
ncbi:unnamed protein product, partial [Prorocentrum cordatum]